MTTKIEGYKCPNCGASIPFDPKAQKLKCPYCDTEYEIESLESMKAESNIIDDQYNWNETNIEQINPDGQVTYTCPSCGGVVTGDQSMAASPCPYCGNSIIVAKQFEGMLEPELLIPFKYTKEDATNTFANYLKGKALLPKDFKNNNLIQKVNGMYVPYWLFDCNADCSARFKATKVRDYREGDYEIKETKHYLVYRDGNIDFEKVPVDASAKLTPELLESLEPFNYNDCVPFKTGYLSGYFADKYDDEADVAEQRANERIKNSMIQEITEEARPGYTTCDLENANVRFSNGVRHYVLLPMFILSTTYKGQIYTFAMNGQTGKFSGNLPADKGRAWGYAGIIFLIVFAVVFCIMFFIVK